jgi:phage baseplate assembly protein W
MNIDHPFHVDKRGRTAETGDAAHIRDLVEQVLMTAPGERVNRPDFGSGLRELVFAPAGDELATATQFVVQSSLERWLGDRIEVNRVEVDAVSAGAGVLQVEVSYTIRATQEQITSTFVQEGVT